MTTVYILTHASPAPTDEQGEVRAICYTHVPTGKGTTRMVPVISTDRATVEHEAAQLKAFHLDTKYYIIETSLL